MLFNLKGSNEWRYRWLVLTGAAALLVSAACVAGRPLVDGHCPCVSGWVCQEDTNLCVPANGGGGTGNFIVDGGMGGAGATADHPPAATLTGIWRGTVAVTAPGCAGGPFDTLRVVIDGEGKLSYFSFDGFPRSQAFGAEETKFPLQGTRDVFGSSGGCPSAACGYHVSVATSSFASDRFALAYDAVGTAVTSAQFAETIAGTLDDQHLAIDYSNHGLCSGDVVAQGRLARE